MYCSGIRLVIRDKYFTEEKYTRRRDPLRYSFCARWNGNADVDIFITLMLVFFKICILSGYVNMRMKRRRIIFRGFVPKNGWHLWKHVFLKVSDRADVGILILQNVER